MSIFSALPSFSAEPAMNVWICSYTDGLLLNAVLFSVMISDVSF